MRELDVELPSGGDRCRAWLLLPESTGQAAACVVMGHGLGLTRSCSLRELATAFVEAGYVVLLFDYRGFGDSGGAPRQLISFAKQLEDWKSAVAYARSRPEVDPSRIVTWGFSLGGGHALTVASRDPDVAAVIAVVPMFSGLSSTLAAMRGWNVSVFLRLVGRASLDFLGALFGRRPVTAPVAAKPGELGLLTGAGTLTGYQAVVPSDFRYELAARIALYFWTYAPGLRLRRFRRPILVLPSSIDRVNPPGPTLRRARSCTSATIEELECGHMSAILEPHRTRVTRASLAFLEDHLP